MSDEIPKMAGWENENAAADRVRQLERARCQAPSVMDVAILCINDVKPEPISWLWLYWLPKSKLHILAGMMGDGKSTLAFKLAATVASGGKWPDGTQAPVGNVLIWEVRDSLQPLVDFIMRHNCAAFGVTHFTKGTQGKDPRDRVTGSLAFGAAARIVMIAVADKNHEEGKPPRMLMRAKSNIGPLEGGFGYDLVIGPLSYDHPDIEVSSLNWLDAVEGNARDMLAEAEDRSGSKKAPAKEVRDWLQKLLANGPMDESEICKLGTARSYTYEQVKYAKKILDVSSIRHGGLADKGNWSWSLKGYQGELADGDVPF